MYTDKITKMLQDKDTYNVINKNPIRKINVELHDLLKKWKESDYMTTFKLCLKIFSVTIGSCREPVGCLKFINGISHSESSHVSIIQYMLFPYTCIKSSQLTYLNL